MFMSIDPTLVVWLMFMLIDPTLAAFVILC